VAELRVPKLNNNDTEYLLLEWLVPDGTPVHEDDVVVVVETSKAAEELPADTTGVLRHTVKAGAWCHPGTVLGTVEAETTGGAPAASAPVSAPATASTTAPALGSAPEPFVTAPAQVLIDALGITPEQVRSLGVTVVRRSHIEALGEQPRTQRLSRVQRAVAKSVQLSHQTIPAAYTAVRMDLGPALRRAEAQTKEVRRPVGLAEIFVQGVANLHEHFPLFFATVDGTEATLADAPNIGVTIDLGEGLYVPVLHDAATKSTKELASALMRHRLAATTGGFKESELTGANFVVTLHTEHGVVLAIPFVFPGTACALAVTAPQDGTVATIGLAYDHRLINGRDAALFLDSLRNIIESSA
jgi:2-oxoglutarate dehydrogenase E2 component (dihydrolipoamide succinyltransferase)